MAPSLYTAVGDTDNADDHDLVWQFDEACMTLGTLVTEGWQPTSIRYRLAAAVVEQLADALSLNRSEALFAAQCWQEHQRQGAALIATVKLLERCARGERPS